MASAVPVASKTLMLDLPTLRVNLIQHPTPTAKPNTTEHLIRVHAIALCAGELLWYTNFPANNPEKELVPGYDVVGTVITSPPDSPFQPGDAVYTRSNYWRTGCAREYAIVLTEELGRKPERLSWEEAATVPLSAMTAWQALDRAVEGGYEGSNLEGKRVLVTAASGGVGSWVVQLAKLAGAEVVATCGPDNVDFVKGLGVSAALNYREIGIKEWAETGKSQEVDIVIDCIGKKSLEESWWAVKDGGVLISIYQPPEQMKPAGLPAKSVKNLFFVMEPVGEQMKKITKLLDEGRAKPVMDSVFAFEDYEKAFQRLDSGHARGKVVIKVAE